MKSYIEILIDYSNSMGFPEKLELNANTFLLKDGSTRMNLVKKILVNDIIPLLDFVENITVSKFYSLPKTNNFIPIKIYNGKFNLEEIILKINKIKDPNNTGGTPLTQAILHSIKRMDKNDSSLIDKKIILITDGEETGGSDYSLMVKKQLELLKNKCNIFIIGIALTQNALLKAKKIAEESNGFFIDLGNDIDYESIETKKILIKFREKILHSSLEKQENELDEDRKLNDIVLLKKNIEDKNRIINLLSKQITLFHESNSNQNILSFEELNENIELNEFIGLQSEIFVYNHLKTIYNNKLKWNNENGESGLSYDFKISNNDNKIKDLIIECKGTIGNTYQFFLTKNEWNLFLENQDNYQIYFVNDVIKSPKLIIIDNLIEWIKSGKIVPYSQKNINLKADRILFSIMN